LTIKFYCEQRVDAKNQTPGAKGQRVRGALLKFATCEPVNIQWG